MYSVSFGHFRKPQTLKQSCENSGGINFFKCASLVPGNRLLTNYGGKYSAPRMLY